jgi:hypothetical protein
MASRTRASAPVFPKIDMAVAVWAIPGPIFSRPAVTALKAASGLIVLRAPSERPSASTLAFPVSMDFSIFVTMEPISSTEVPAAFAWRAKPCTKSELVPVLVATRSMESANASVFSMAASTASTARCIPSAILDPISSAAKVVAPIPVRPVKKSPTFPEISERASSKDALSRTRC